MIDSEGYRHNVAIVLSNAKGQVLWAKRIGQDAWQFPQGGIQAGENTTDALYRELKEEIGLAPEHVEILASTEEWQYYKLPKNLVRHNSQPLVIGQKQKWFLLKLVGDEAYIKLDQCYEPEFDAWQWVSYWYPLSQIVAFKKQVYQQSLALLIGPLNDAMASWKKPVGKNTRWKK